MLADSPLLRQQPIGVFDSGVGGLSILKALRTELPFDDFVYVADSGFAPYGEREDGFVIERARTLTGHLVGHHHAIKALVVACNTATAAAIHLLRQDYPKLPIIGVEPALRPALALSHTRRIGVLATRSTLNSQKFKNLLSTLTGQGEFICQSCDGLADAIERDDALQIRALCQDYTRVMGQFGVQSGEIDTLVLGCTHYPFASVQLQALVGPEVCLVDTGGPVARQARRVITPNLGAQRCGQLTLLATGDPDALAAAAQRWLGVTAEVRTVLPL